MIFNAMYFWFQSEVDWEWADILNLEGLLGGLSYYDITKR